MEVKSITKMVRISPSKARETARHIRGLSANEAMDVLNFSTVKAARLMEKTLKSAMANAENNFGMDVNSLVVKEAVVNEGPAFKRYQPTARGGAWPIRKRTSHFRIVLIQQEVKPEGEKPKKAQKTKKTKTKASAKPKAAKGEEKK